MKLYNTKSRTIEEFIPRQEGMVKMYTCGPTVYHYAHIGNLRAYLMEDVLEKTLRFLGYQVDRVMNITDVGHLSSDSDSGEDKMVKGAVREHTTVMAIAKRYTDAFLADMKDLNIRIPDTVAPATGHIADYIKIIERLLETGYAYQSGGNVYFDVSKLDDYYVLTNHKEDEMVVGAREGVLEDQYKRNQADFALWFTKSKFEDQDLKWESPFGVGYPGWHIECSGISMHYLGEYLDLHCGGIDNIFPHHTNEIAQSEAYLGHPWCKYWFHVEHLNDERGKMSKSKGEFLTVSVLKEKGYDPLAYRLMCLYSHYRKTLVFSFDALDQAASTYQKLKKRVQALDSEGPIMEDAFASYLEQFKESLRQDLNTSNALTILYEVLKDNVINDATKRALVDQFDQVFSLDLLKEETKTVSPEILEKIAQRTQAKAEKNYLLADQIRDELWEMGIVLKDTREGTSFEYR